MITHTRKLIERGAQVQQEWQQAYDEWAAANPERRELHERLIKNELSPGWRMHYPAGLPIPKALPLVQLLERC